MCFKVNVKVVEIPKNIQNLVFLNISSWVGEVTNLWNIYAS
jgi:hypothetical protein